MVNLPVKSQIYRYAYLAKSSSEYSKRMERLSNRIFTEVVRPTKPTNLRVVERMRAEPLDLRQDIVNHYPRHPEIFDIMKIVRAYGLYRDEHLDFQEEIERLRELRGKSKKAFLLKFKKN